MKVSTETVGSPSPDRGSTLIIAIGFVMAIGSIAAGLSALVVSSMNSRGTLIELRDTEYAADGAIEAAIAEVRTQPGDLSSACGDMAGSRVEVLNGQSIRVDWYNACGVVRGGDGAVVAQRNVIFAACPDTGATCLEDAIVIRAQVNFEQTTTGAVTETFVQTWSVNR